MEIALSHFISEINRFLMFYAEIQDGRQKWLENNFCKKSPVALQIPCGSKILLKMALSHSVSNINRFLPLTQKFKMASKSGRKTIFRKIASRLCRYPAGQKFCRNRSISLHFRNRQVLLLTQKFKMAAKSGGKTIFAKSCQ